ncbi:MAG: 30S ribosomal protein S18 [Gemmatimonadota bacterium]|nr:30S ribosomal protein S18 [Gemmatimonadota bacterium]
MRAYEIVYILDSALEREAVDAKLEAFHDVLGGEITAVDHWGVRQLAYPIRKSKTGYYVIVHVDADPAALPEFERVVKLDEETTRYLIVVNEGQPTTGASVLADRPAAPEPEDEGGDTGGDEGGDASPAGEAEGDEPAAEPQPTGPPEFSGARGRRRRHEGPPIVLLNYKDVTTLARFLTEQGKILPKRTTKVSARFQRRLGIAIKRARHIALLPYIRDHEA